MGYSGEIRGISCRQILVLLYAGMLDEVRCLHNDRAEAKDAEHRPDLVPKLDGIIETCVVREHGLRLASETEQTQDAHQPRAKLICRKSA